LCPGYFIVSLYANNRIANFFIQIVHLGEF
jgi:hypothetical protein